MAKVEMKLCFGCNQPTNNWKYEPETLRYYGADCWRRIEKSNLSPMEYNKCQGCGLSEAQCFNQDSEGQIKTFAWWDIKAMGGVKKLCFPCFMRTDEYKEYEKKEAKKKELAEQEAKEAIEKEREEYKKKYGKYPENDDPSKWTEEQKKESQEQVKKELENAGETSTEQPPKKEKPKSKAQIKREAKEQAQNEARCIFCGDAIGYDIRKLEEIKTADKLKHAVLLCLQCLTGENLTPSDGDLKNIRKSWADGGMVITNIKVFPRAENLLLKMVEEGLKLGAINIYSEQGKFYLETQAGGNTIELNTYAKRQISKSWDIKQDFKGYFQTFSRECSLKHQHEIKITRKPFSSETPFDDRDYKIENCWDNALSEYSDTNGYTMEEWEEQKKQDQVLKNCADFKDYPKKGKRTDKIFNETDLKWLDEFENGRKEKF